MPHPVDLTPSPCALVTAMRLWHFERESWWTRMQALGSPLGVDDGRDLLMSLDGLMTVLAKHSLCDVVLRPVACKRLSREEHAFVQAVECAGARDEDGCRAALSAFLDGDNLRFAQSLMTGIAGHLTAIAGASAGSPPAGRC